MNDLNALYDLTDRVASDVHAAYPYWPCKKGCDVLDGKNCCHHALFPVSVTEWLRLRTRIGEMPRTERRRLTRIARSLYDRLKMADYAGDYLRFLREHGTDEAVCPLLDTSGACSVYGDHPVICRSFGYWQDAENGKWCRVVGETVRKHQPKQLPGWGHLAARMTQTLRAPVKPLVAWIVEDQEPR